MTGAARSKLGTFLSRIVIAAGMACAAQAPSAGAAESERSEPAASAQQAPQVLVMLPMPATHFRADSAYAGAYRNDSGRSARRRIADELARTHGLSVVSNWPMPVLGVDCYVLALPPGADPIKVAGVLAGDARVAWAQPVAIFHAMGQGDPLYPVQPAAQLWQLSQLHLAATGRKTTVAVIDSGIDEQHPDLAGQVLLKMNFIDDSAYVAENHGTAVAGIIAAQRDNGIGIRGVAPDAHLLALRACREMPGASTQCNSFSLGKALHFAVMRTPTVINLSLSGPPDRLLQGLLDVALARGIKIVGAIDPQMADGGFPAAWPGVFAVGDGSAGAATGAPLAAPGRDIPTTLPDARFGMVTGSSYSAAHMSGLLALLSELRPQASAAQMREFLNGGDGLRKVSSNALTDACAALARAARSCVCACPGAATLTALHQP